MLTPTSQQIVRLSLYDMHDLSVKMHLYYVSFSSYNAPILFLIVFNLLDVCNNKLLVLLATTGHSFCFHYNYLNRRLRRFSLSCIPSAWTVEIFSTDNSLPPTNSDSYIRLMKSSKWKLLSSRLDATLCYTLNIECQRTLDWVSSEPRSFITLHACL